MVQYFLDLTPDQTRELPPGYGILSAPLEKTVSYGKGAAGAPEAILKASIQLEEYDEEVSLNPCKIRKIMTYPQLDLNQEEGDSAALIIKESIRGIMQRGEIPILLGGEHTVSIGAVEACLEAYPELHIVQIDAHADLRDSYQNCRYSHACVMRRIFEMGVPIHATGIRTISEEEAALIKEHKLHILFDHKRRDSPDWISEFIERIPVDAPVYLTIDVDGLDPAIMPSTGTPVPGGLSWAEVLGLVMQLIQRCRLVGFDVVELAPRPENHAPDFLCAQLIYKIIAYNEAFRSNT